MMTALEMVSKLPFNAPWWAYLLVILACLAAYTCRQVLAYKIGTKALEKVTAEKVPEVVNSVTGYHGKSQKRP